MKVIFRVDASLKIGTGHVMRCLTLADELMIRGAQCEFISREHEGNLIGHIQAKGYVVHRLTLEDANDIELAHGGWLGATQAQDAEACTRILAERRPDWLVVDHYALDARWEEALRPRCGRIMAIDDLANRRHTCDLLLDQTIGRKNHDYRTLAPDRCALMCGTDYALLRPEFAALRPYSLARRAKPELTGVFVNLGGVDQENLTSRVLRALADCPLPAKTEITVVMGSTAPWLQEVRQLAQNLPNQTTIHVGVDNMAELMANSDLAIGAAGTTSWERCCLGLPTISLVLAENQVVLALNLETVGAARVLRLHDNLENDLAALINEVGNDAAKMAKMSHSASAIVNGQGAQIVSSAMYA